MSSSNWDCDEVVVAAGVGFVSGEALSVWLGCVEVVVVAWGAMVVVAKGVVLIGAGRGAHVVVVAGEDVLDGDLPFDADVLR